MKWQIRVLNPSIRLTLIRIGLRLFYVFKENFSCLCVK